MARASQHFTGVKQLIDSGIVSIPDAYVRPQEERATEVHTNEGIPIIDLSQHRDVLVQQVGNACEEWGFFQVDVHLLTDSILHMFQVINHGFPSNVTAQMFAAAHEFHALPNEEKMRYVSTDNRSRMRYGTSFNIKNDKILNWRDFLRHDCTPREEMQELLPENPLSYRQAVADYSKHVGILGNFLLELISESLGLAPDYISKTLGVSETMASNYYPPCPQPELTFGLAPHSDPGTLTLLAQDSVGGLHIRHKNDWIFVKPVENAIIVNIADQLQILTNDRYKSAEHRAIVNSKNARMSIPFVIGPAWESIVQPAPELVERDRRTVFRPTVYKDYMTSIQMNGLDQKRAIFEGLKV